MTELSMTWLSTLFLLPVADHGCVSSPPNVMIHMALDWWRWSMIFEESWNSIMFFRFFVEINGQPGLGEAAVIRGILCLYQRETTNGQRNAAFSLFETYKDNADIRLTFGSLFIVSDGLDEKLLRFELLQNFIRKGWALKHWNMDAMKFKREIILYLQGTLSFSFPEQLQMKNAISKLLISLIIRKFPQKWPGLLFQLYELVKISKYHNILVLAVFQRVAEEIINTSNSWLDSHRTKDIRLFLIQSSHLEPLMTLICNNCSVVNLYLVEVTEGSLKLASQSLFCLNQYIEWMPFEELERSNIREYLVLFLSNDPFLVAAVDCLIAMLKRRNGSVKERAFLLSIFKMPFLQKLNDVTVE